MDMHDKRVKKARAESNDDEYKSKRSLLQLIDDVYKRVVGAQNERHRSQLERQQDVLMNELVVEWENQSHVGETDVTNEALCFKLCKLANVLLK